jgi:GDP-D-mannose dehydratase
VYVVSTGVAASVRDFCTYCYKKAGITDLEWRGHKLLTDRGSKVLIEANDSFYVRTKEVPYLRGDCSKLKKDFGWLPTYSWQ